MRIWMLFSFVTAQYGTAEGEAYVIRLIPPCTTRYTDRHRDRYANTPFHRPIFSFVLFVCWIYAQRGGEGNRGWRLGHSL